MITQRELETIRGALLFWKEELCPHPPEMLQPYFDAPLVDPLSAEETEELRSALLPVRIRFAGYDPLNQRLTDIRLFRTPAEAASTLGTPLELATVVLPPMR